MNDSETIDTASTVETVSAVDIVDKKQKKNPKRVAAGKKGAEARKLKAELRRKEADSLKTENVTLKSITIVDDTPPVVVSQETSQEGIKVYKNYIPLCILVAGVAGLGFYLFRPKSLIGQPVNDIKVVQLKQSIPPIQPKQEKQEKYDPFEF